MNNTEFESYYAKDDNVRIYQGLMPIAKNLSKKYYKYHWGNDAYHEGMLCAIGVIESGDIMEIGHDNYMGYLVSKMRGHISDKFRQYIFLNKGSKRYKKEGMYIIFDVDVLITDPQWQLNYSYENKAIETLETLDKLCNDDIDRQIMLLRAKGFNETEVSQKVGMSQQAVSLRLIRLWSAYKKLMKE